MLSTSTTKFTVRLAHESEAHLLNELANRSKAYWPYDADYLDLVRSIVHVTSDDIRAWPFSVAVENKRICGFSAVCESGGERMLDHLWIEPTHIKKGFGQALFIEGVKSAKELGWSMFTIASDPYAENFYIKMGANRIGEKESKVKKGFFMPLLEYRFP